MHRRPPGDNQDATECHMGPCETAEADARILLRNILYATYRINTLIYRIYRSDLFDRKEFLIDGGNPI